jgi:hypothetical protein
VRRRPSHNARSSTTLLSLLLALAACGAAVGATVDFNQTTDPLGLFSVSERRESGVMVATTNAPFETDVYRFCLWEINGVTNRDELGRARNPAPFLLLENTTALARYLNAALDQDTNGIPDWWERYLHTNLTVSAEADDDRDVFAARQEYAYDLHPRVPDRIADGGYAATFDATALVVTRTNLAVFTRRSNPEGLTVTLQMVTNRGSQLTLPALISSTGGYNFAYWSLNGLVQTDALGRALAGASFTLESNTTAEALYVPTTQDSDGDGLLDWLELNYYSTTSPTPASDDDGDAFTLQDELAYDLHPRVPDRITDGGFAATFEVATRVIANTNFALYTRRSDPEGLLATTQIVTNRGLSFTLPAQYGSTGGYNFAYWSLNGAAQTDALGRALSSVSFVLQSETTAEARYILPTQDSDRDGLADWLELNFHGTTNAGPADDSDGDGFMLKDELAYDLHPRVPDRIEDGGYAATFEVATRVIANTNLAVYARRSDPEGLLATAEVITNRGTLFALPALYGPTGSYSFAYWTLNGLVQTDALGRARSSAAFTLHSDTSAEARYLLSAQDADGDGLADWLEWNYLGALSATPSTDHDGDGIALKYELAYDLHPRVRDRIEDGGYTATFGDGVLVSFNFYPRVTESLANGVAARFFTADTATSGVFSVAANSHPALGDWDGDGDLDLFVGASNGVLRIFENAGSPRVLNLVERTSNFTALAFAWTNIVNPAPALGDWSGDGRADLAIGGGPTSVVLIQSSGSFTSSPVSSFQFPVSGTPSLLDVNHDALPDLLLLSPSGLVSAYTNTHTPTLPYSDTPFSSNLLGTAVPSATGLTTADVNGDGVQDVLISDQNGNIWEFHGAGP